MPAARAAAVLAVGLVLTAGIPLAWTLTRPPPDEGSVAPVLSASPAPSVPLAPPASTAPPVSTAPPAPAAAAPPASVTPEPAPEAEVAAAVRPVTRSARIADLQRREDAAAPQRIRIPALGVDAAVVAVGVEPGGSMQLPADVGQVGWYRHGPAPGDAGAALLAAHVDSRVQGRGVFFDLRRLGVGTQVVVSDSSGGEQHFEVVARRTYDKAELPAGELFSRTGPPRLVLVTCGGGFDRAAGTYQANVVIHAVPSPANA